MQKQTVRRQLRLASCSVHTNGDPAAARKVAHRENMPVGGYNSSRIAQMKTLLRDELGHVPVGLSLYPIVRAMVH